MVDPVEAAARSIAKDCGYSYWLYPEYRDKSPLYPQGSSLFDPEHWRRIARNALAASVAAAQAMNEAEDAGRASQS